MIWSLGRLHTEAQLQFHSEGHSVSRAALEGVPRGGTPSSFTTEYMHDRKVGGYMNRALVVKAQQCLLLCFLYLPHREHLDSFSLVNVPPPFEVSAHVRLELN